MSEKITTSDLSIHSHFDKYKDRKLQRGIETMSETAYKGYIIHLRAYNYSGITGKIIKVLESGKRVHLRRMAYNFRIPIDFLFELKKYIDDNEAQLINKLNEKTND